jgi:MoaA/NifB/PqqE/SkfB family radical SAM enzyme
MGTTESRHPCFSMDAAHRHARIHLPVAPRCNIRCLYCNRKYDCVNESRPGVTAAVLSPSQALARYVETKRLLPNLAVAGIAGPGDALANPEATFEAFRLLREEDPQVEFCLSTNGLAVAEHIGAIRDAGVRHVTVTVNTRRLATASFLYPWVNDRGVVLRGEEGAALLLSRQEEALEALREIGATVKVNTICIPGVNDDEVEEVARFARGKGASLLNVMPFIPTPGTFFESFSMVSREALDRIRDRAAAILPQMRHCRQCRADAVGNVLSEKPVFFDRARGMREMTEGFLPPTGETSGGATAKVAVASSNGVSVDLHFGHAEEFLVYEASGDGAIRFLERRKADRYCSGAEGCPDGASRMERVLSTLADCSAVVALRIGDGPRQALERRGIRAFLHCFRVEEAIRECAPIVLAEGRSAEAR